MVTASRAAAYCVQELPSVRDDDQRLGPLGEVVLKPQHRVQVQVVLRTAGSTSEEKQPAFAKSAVNPNFRLESRIKQTV